jgi:hypothetical protein
LGFPTPQFLDRHRGEGDCSRLARLRVLLPNRAIIALLGGCDDGELTAIKINRAPAQGSDFATAQAAQ